MLNMAPAQWRGGPLPSGLPVPGPVAAEGKNAGSASRMIAGASKAEAPTWNVIPAPAPRADVNGIVTVKKHPSRAHAAGSRR